MYVCHSNIKHQEQGLWYTRENLVYSHSAVPSLDNWRYITHYSEVSIIWNVQNTTFKNVFRKNNICFGSEIMSSSYRLKYFQNKNLLSSE